MPLKDIQPFLPRMELGKTTTKTEIVDHIKERTGLHKSDVVAMLAEIEDTLLHFLKMGRSVKLEGIGTFSPSIKLDGKIKVNLRLNRRLGDRLNMAGEYSGEIKNRENIGKTMADLEALAAE